MSDQHDAKDQVDGDAILGLHTDLTNALEDFLAFAAAAQNDLATKCEALAVAQNDRTVKSYAQCQVRFLQMYRKRLEEMQQAAAERFKKIADRAAVSDSGRLTKEMTRFKDDLGAMGRRCKQMLDASDKYCVLDGAGEQDAPLVDQVDARRHTNTPQAKLKEKQNLVVHTLESFASHAGVMAKTYTRRMSASGAFSFGDK